ncbi:MAG TPA: TIGR02217 family protein [Rhodospirillaceae bacterium]|nr:TIGR02217 family protein [Rhodospirillaceae bacterium]
MTFHEISFPSDIAYGATGGPEYLTTVVSMASGHEQRNANWSAARGKWNVASGLKHQAQLNTLIAFFRARKGRAFGFRFKDWTDYRATAQPIGVGDGANITFQLVKTYTSGAGNETRTITKPVLGTVKPYLAGVLQPSGWSINTATGVLTFTVAPAHGVAVTVDFDFDVPVRFDTDSMAVTIEQIDLHQWSDIPIIEIRV